MIAKFLLLFYWLTLGCSLPFTIGIKHAASINKLNWSNSVFITVVDFTQELCFEDGECVMVGRNFATGTSFVIDQNDNSTIMMSAAHLCLQDRTEQSIEREGAAGTLVATATMFIDINNRQYFVDEILFKDDSTDICIYSTKEVVPYPPLRIANSLPAYGEEIWTIGAPTGFMPDSAKPISRGVFSGEAIRRHPMTDPTAFATYSMPTVQGMSGSPIMDSQGRVIGIVSAVHSDWHMVSFSPTLDQIKWAIDETIED